MVLFLEFWGHGAPNQPDVLPNRPRLDVSFSLLAEGNPRLDVKGTADTQIFPNLKHTLAVPKSPWVWAG